MEKLYSIVLFALCAMLVACGTEDGMKDVSEMTGSAPVIEHMTMTPETAAIDTMVELTFDGTLSDPDRDLAFILLTVLKDGVLKESSATRARVDMPSESVPYNFSMFFQPTQTGEYEVRMYLVDAQGHQSIGKTATITVQ